MTLDAVVRVVPVTREWAEALAEGDNVFGERFGVGVEAARVSGGAFPDLNSVATIAGAEYQAAWWRRATHFAAVLLVRAKRA
jgi:hypothetical protein